MIAGLTLVFGVIPLCSHVRGACLQGVALANILPGTEWAVCQAAASSLIWCYTPAMLLPCWALGTEPEDLLGASLSSVVGKVAMRCIALMVPLCQDSFASRVPTLCKCWVPGPLLCQSSLCTLWAAISFFADALIGCCAPLMTTGITEPTNTLMALCHHAVRCTSICFVVPLSCNQGSPGKQRVVLAHSAAAALRTSIAFGPLSHCRFPSVQVAVWALITYPPDLPVTVWFDVNVA